MSAPSASTAGVTGTSLWRRLCALQPTLSLETAAIIHPPPAAQHRPAMSYSFVVVPPPVPSATPNFEAHISSLLAHVPHPTFVTCTSYSPYFNDPAAEERAAQSASVSDSESSATQKALSFLQAHLPVDTGLVLTITGTRATADAPADATRPSTTLTGASEDGIRAVMRDFVLRLKVPRQPTAPPSERQEESPKGSRGAGLMVLRGDDGGYTRRHMEADGSSSSSCSSEPNPYAAFADGAALLRFVSSEQHHHRHDTQSSTSALPAREKLCLFTGGYAQGHVLDRVWGGTPTQGGREGEEAVDKDCATTTTANANADAAAAVLGGRQTSPSLSFLGHQEKAYSDTEAQVRHAQGPHHDPRPASVETCRELVDALLARLHAVRHLWLTPSTYTAEARAASARQLVEDKVLLRNTDGQRANPQDGGCGARVVVTQMLTSAREFTQFAEDVQRALREAVSRAPQRSVEDAAVILVPGLMAPLRGDQFIRSALQLKVIPSEPLQAALRAYEDALRAAQAALESSASSSAVEEFQKIKEKAETTFLNDMEDFTVALAADLHACGYTHVNFSAFQYGCGEAIGRVAARLPH